MSGSTPIFEAGTSVHFQGNALLFSASGDSEGFYTAQEGPSTDYETGRESQGVNTAESYESAIESQATTITVPEAAAKTSKHDNLGAKDSSPNGKHQTNGARNNAGTANQENSRNGHDCSLEPQLKRRKFHWDSEHVSDNEEKEIADSTAVDGSQDIMLSHEEEHIAIKMTNNLSEHCSKTKQEEEGTNNKQSGDKVQSEVERKSSSRTEQRDSSMELYLMYVDENVREALRHKSKNVRSDEENSNQPSHPQEQRSLTSEEDRSDDDVMVDETHMSRGPLDQLEESGISDTGKQGVDPNLTALHKAVLSKYPPEVQEVLKDCLVTRTLAPPPPRIPGERRVLWKVIIDSKLEYIFVEKEPNESDLSKHARNVSPLRVFPSTIREVCQISGNGVRNTSVDIVEIPPVDSQESLSLPETESLLPETDFLGVHSSSTPPCINANISSNLPSNETSKHISSAKPFRESLASPLPKPTHGQSQSACLSRSPQGSLTHHASALQCYNYTGLTSTEAEFLVHALSSMPEIPRELIEVVGKVVAKPGGGLPAEASCMIRCRFLDKFCDFQTYLLMEAKRAVQSGIVDVGRLLDIVEAIKQKDSVSERGVTICNYQGLTPSQADLLIRTMACENNVPSQLLELLRNFTFDPTGGLPPEDHCMVRLEVTDKGVDDIRNKLRDQVNKGISSKIFNVGNFLDLAESLRRQLGGPGNQDPSPIPSRRRKRAVLSSSDSSDETSPTTSTALPRRKSPWHSQRLITKSKQATVEARVPVQSSTVISSGGRRRSVYFCGSDPGNTNPTQTKGSVAARPTSTTVCSSNPETYYDAKQTNRSDSARSTSTGEKVVEDDGVLARPKVHPQNNLDVSAPDAIGQDRHPPNAECNKASVDVDRDQEDIDSARYAQGTADPMVETPVLPYHSPVDIESQDPLLPDTEDLLRSVRFGRRT